MKVFKQKQLLASILAICMMFTLFNVAFAEDESASEDQITTAGMEVISVHGYVGPFTVVTPPDPDDPDPPETEIYVEVPVKILFAAFDSHEGAVTSPKFKITNLSSTSDIKVEIEGFEQRNDPDVILDNRLSLKLVTLDEEDLVSELYPSSYASAKIIKESLSKVIEGSNGNVIEFMVGGTWTGAFDKELKPIFDMTIKFSGTE